MSSLAHLDVRLAIARAVGAGRRARRRTGRRAGAGSLLHTRVFLGGLEKLDERRHILHIALLGNFGLFGERGAGLGELLGQKSGD